VFLEPTRPFSVKAFDKLEDLLGQAGEDRITVKVRLQSLPWHMYSGVIVRCILAASTLEGGRTAAKSHLLLLVHFTRPSDRLVSRSGYNTWPVFARSKTAVYRAAFVAVSAASVQSCSGHSSTWV